MLPFEEAHSLSAVDPAVIALLESGVAIEAAAVVVVEIRRIVRTAPTRSAQREQIVGTAGPGTGLMLILRAGPRAILGPVLVTAAVIPGTAHIVVAAASPAAAAIVGPAVVTASAAALTSVIIAAPGTAPAVVVAAATSPATAVVTGTATAMIIAPATAAAAAVVSAAPSPIAAAIAAAPGHRR